MAAQDLLLTFVRQFKFIWGNWRFPECWKHSRNHGATTGIRTLDLSLTKDALYH